MIIVVQFPNSAQEDKKNELTVIQNAEKKQNGRTKKLATFWLENPSSN